MDLPKGKPILTLDFDGVIHSYSSGWKGAGVIPDPPVPGAIEFICRAMELFQIAIFSSRSHQWGGRKAMKRFIKNEFIKIGIALEDWNPSYNDNPIWNFIAETAFADPWPDEVEYAAKRFVKNIKFPLFKPPSFLMLDDRAMLFNGDFTSPEILAGFKPWYRRPDPLAENNTEYKLSREDWEWIFNQLDDTGGILIKESELEWIIEHFVKKERRRLSFWRNC